MTKNIVLIGCGDSISTERTSEIIDKISGHFKNIGIIGAGSLDSALESISMIRATDADCVVIVGSDLHCEHIEHQIDDLDTSHVVTKRRLAEIHQMSRIVDILEAQEHNRMQQIIENLAIDIESYKIDYDFYHDDIDIEDRRSIEFSVRLKDRIQQHKFKTAYKPMLKINKHRIRSTIKS